MATKTIRKGLVGLEDLTRGTSTISRGTSSGGTQTITQIPLYIGTGTPEGIVTAGVGSIFLRTDGGAGTTLYVKQSGTGNTGWVGK